MIPSPIGTRTRCFLRESHELLFCTALDEQQMFVLRIKISLLDRTLGPFDVRESFTDPLDRSHTSNPVALKSLIHT
jgi:hypothetical protein